jgi:hypothetical protein
VEYCTRAGKKQRFSPWRLEEHRADRKLNALGVFVPAGSSPGQARRYRPASTGNDDQVHDLRIGHRIIARDSSVLV